VKIPNTFEGDNFSGIIRKGKEKKNHASLYMGITPFANVGKEFNKEYRIILAYNTVGD